MRVSNQKDNNDDIKIKRLYADDVGICGKVIIIQNAMNKNVNVKIRYNSKQGILNKEIRLYPYMKSDLNVFMAELLNIKPPDMVLETELNPTNNAISLERLPDLDAGYLIVSAGYGASSANNQGVADQRLANLKKDELWKNLPAVKANHVLQVDSTLWMAHGIIAKERAMKELYDTWGE